MATQAIVHVIRGGGARTVKRICSQWEYLTRKGTLQLQFSERHGAGFVPYSELPAWAKRWAEQSGNYVDGQHVADAEQDMTTHIVFSLPPGTDKDAAYRALRNTAEDVFGASVIREDQRSNPDEFDYLTAFHTDRPHPHLHVIVNRRSLQQNADTLKHEWLKIAQRNARVNYDIMRAKLVYWARREGIDLEATSRRERGILTPSLTTEQFRMNARRAVGVHEHFEDAVVAVFADDAPPLPRFESPVGNAGRSRHGSPSGSGAGPSGGGPGGEGDARSTSAIDAQRSSDAERQRRDQARQDHAARQDEDAEGDRTRRRISQNASPRSQEDAANDSGRRSPSRSPSAGAAGHNQGEVSDDDQLQFWDDDIDNRSSPVGSHATEAAEGASADNPINAARPQGGGQSAGAGAGERAQDNAPPAPPRETEAEANARRAAARARRRGDDLDRIIRTRNQKIEEGPISGRTRGARRPPDRIR